jgi:hypothetical protein
MASDPRDPVAVPPSEPVGELEDEPRYAREPAPEPVAEHTTSEPPQGMLPARDHRATRVERGLMRIVATIGIVAIDVLLGAILVGQDVAGWIVGLVIGLVSVILAGVLWSSRQL